MKMVRRRAAASASVVATANAAGNRLSQVEQAHGRAEEKCSSVRWQPKIR